MSDCVLAAVDLGSSSARVLYHAAGLARLLSARLRIMHVTADAPDAEQRLADFCAQWGPYEVDPDQVDTIVRSGVVSETIFREAQKCGARMVVMGSRGHGAVARLLLGSTSAAVLMNAPSPVLLVPPTDLEIVNITDRVTLNSGPVLAAVDFSETCANQLVMASTLAEIAGQPLLLMSVAPKRIGDHEAAALLRERGHGLEPRRPRALIVRRGKVAEEIARCALEERSGLVVMGLRSARRGRPGSIAAAVLGTKRAFVLAVPGC